MNTFNINNSHIEEATLGVSNIQDAIAFYVNTIKLDLIESNENTATLGSNGVSFLQLVKRDRHFSNQEGLYHIAFLLKDQTQLANWLKLNQSYLVFQGASDHGVSEAIYLSDPDGNGIEIYADKSLKEWPTDGKEILMVTERLNVDALFSRVTNDNTFDFVIGHIHLQSNSIDDMFTFYDTLGLNLTLSLPGAKFVSYDGYHHHLAFNHWHAPLKMYHQNDTGIQSFTIALTEDLYDSNIIQSLIDSETQEKTSNYFMVKDPIGIQIKIKKGVKK